MRKALILLFSCTVALFAAYAGYRGYKVWKQSHMISLARSFMAKGDTRNALLAVEQALRANPINLEATRLMADLAQSANSPSALFWRSRVVDLAPTSLDDRLAHARLALAISDLVAATNALAGVSDAGHQTAGYHIAAGGVAAATGNLAEAEAQFLAASQFEPTNSVTQLNLALVRLAQTNAQVKAEGRASLKELCSNPQLCCQALRELIGDALRTRQNKEALALSKELLQQSNSVFRDRLLRLDVLRETRDFQFNASLAAFQKEAGNDPVKITALATWQLGRIGPRDTLATLNRLPVAVHTNTMVALLIADCQVQLTNWPGLQTALARQNWGELEFTRHAFLARAYRGQNLIDSSKTEWEQAIKGANTAKQSIAMLLGLAIKWNWESEAEDLLWTMVNHFPQDQSAFQALSRALFATGRTRPLLTLFAQQVKRWPGDLSVKNNLAVMAFLLDAKELKPHDLAREVYEKDPTNSTFASTYAYSLLLQSRDAEALKIMEKLPPRELEKPAIAGYYGLILKATGNKDKAKVYLRWAQKARLLPEERERFAQALASI